MKIGIIGINMYPKQLNFACGLHTFAFQQFLLQNNIQSEVIDYKPVYFNNFDMAHPATYYKKLYASESENIADTPEKQEQKNERLASLQYLIDAWSELYTERENRYYKFQAFLNKYYIKTSEQYDSDLLEVKDPGFDCYICVTDVIWKTLPVHTYDRGFFLASKAMEGKQKIAYAASRGVPQPYTPAQQDLFFKYINDIDTISVREKSTKDFIETNSTKKVDLVLDPVLLHDKSFWKKYSVKPKENNYLLLYYVMAQATDTISYAVQYAKEHDLLIVELSDMPEKEGRITDPDVKHIALHDVGMEEYLGYIEHANCIFTNSFHGCCFSIIFEKLFYAGERSGDKVANLLDIFNLNTQRLANYIKIDTFEEDVHGEIDYLKVREILGKERLKSGKFILDAITTAEYNLKENKQKEMAVYEAHKKGLTFPINYHSGLGNVASNYDLTISGASLKKLASGKLEYTNNTIHYKNDMSCKFQKNNFAIKGKEFIGWTLRFKVDTRWFWIMENDAIVPEDEITRGMKKKIFVDESTVPYIPVNNIRIAVAEAKWRNHSIIKRLLACLK